MTSSFTKNDKHSASKFPYNIKPLINVKQQEISTNMQLVPSGYFPRYSKIKWKTTRFIELFCCEFRQAGYYTDG